MFRTVNDKITSAETDVSKFYKKFSLNSEGSLINDKEYAIDLIALVNSDLLNIDYLAETLPTSISGLLIKNDDEKFIMKTNARESEQRQRFTIAHELGHYYYNTPWPTTNDVQIEYRDGSDDPEEKKIDEFAATILMPKQKLIRYINENDNSINVPAMAKAFNVSPDSLYVRLDRLGII